MSEHRRGTRCSVCVFCGRCFVDGEAEQVDAVSHATNWADAFKEMDDGSAGAPPPTPGAPGECDAVTAPRPESPLHAKSWVLTIWRTLPASSASSRPDKPDGGSSRPLACLLEIGGVECLRTCSHTRLAKSVMPLRNSRTKIVRSDSPRKIASRLSRVCSRCPQTFDTPAQSLIPTY